MSMVDPRHVRGDSQATGRARRTSRDQIGTREQVVEETFIRVFIALLRPALLQAWSRLHVLGNHRCAALPEAFRKGIFQTPCVH